MKKTNERIEILKDFVNVLNQKEIRNIIEKADNKDHVISDCLRFLIATRDLEGLEEYKLKYNPSSAQFNYCNIREFMLDKDKTLDSKSVEIRLFDNIFTNGYMFHGTNVNNSDFIIERGLVSANEQYGYYFNQYLDSVNEMYKKIHTKVKGRPPFMDVINRYHSDLDEVYFTPSIDTGFLYSSTSNELLKTYVRSLTEFFEKNDDEVPYEDYDKTIDYVKNMIEDSNYDFNKHDALLFTLFLQRYYPKKGITTDDSRSVVFVPFNKKYFGEEIIDDFDTLRSFAGKSICVESLLNSFPNNEITTHVPINPKDLGIIEVDNDNNFTLKKVK